MSLLDEKVENYEDSEISSEEQNHHKGEVAEKVDGL